MSEEDSSSKSSQKENSSKRKGRSFLQFSAMGFQMAVTIGGMAWLGNYLDTKYQNEKPIWTIILSLSGIAISLYLVIKQSSKLSKDD